MNDLRIGLASNCTTPGEPLWMQGYAHEKRFRPSDGKLQDLHAKAMAVEDAPGTRVVLITLDLCVLRKSEAEVFYARIAEATGLTRARIILNLSHTHSGPIIGAGETGRYPMTAEYRARTVAYTATLADRLAEVAAAAIADLQPALLSRGTGEVGFVRNRRKFDENGAYAGMGPNPNGFTDPHVEVFCVDAPDNTRRAILCGLACHSVTLGPDNLAISGDYPGFAQQMIETERPGVQAMFMQGCGADANTEPRSTPDQLVWVERHGRELADEVERVTDTELTPIGGPIRAAHSWVDLPLRTIPSDVLDRMAEGPRYMADNAKRIRDAADRGETPPTSYRAPIVAWQFGDDLTLIALPGETCSGYITFIREALGTERLWVAGYCNEVFGYLPTAQIIAEGGYEDRGLICDIGYFACEAEDVVLNAVRRLAEEVGR